MSDRGVNFFDTANVYAGRRDAGSALKGRREQVVLASKVRLKMGDARPTRAASPRGVLRPSTKPRACKTDYLDIYYLHAGLGCADREGARRHGSLVRSAGAIPG